MGLFSAIVAYKIGKRAGRKRAERRAEREAGADDFEGHPDCINYDSFCRNYGGCDGMACEFEDDGA